MSDRPSRNSLTVAGLFAGIGGIELGLHQAGHRTEFLCELDAGAAAVLKDRFQMRVVPDVKRLRGLPKVDLIAAGFPCQDLSQAGQTAGIGGNQSSLIGEVFKRLPRRAASPRWLLLENVPFMLQLQRGRAMQYLVDELEALGFTWAYRVIDARAFGLPQRRHRVVLLASRTEDPRGPLFGCDAGECLPAFSRDRLCGFYWTEGLRGLGWAVDAVPTLKGGSTIGIPSPPAIWDPLDGSITIPDVRDAERLQGFETDWTAAALSVKGVRRGHRWKLVGNAVSVRMANWIGCRLATPVGEGAESSTLKRGAVWPRAAWGHRGQAYTVHVSMWPVRQPSVGLREFLAFPRLPLSRRAAAGFLSRAEVSGLKFEAGFLEDVRRHIKHLAGSTAA
jgi:DNA (cytosine-5)-methyltransferase 1